MNEATATLSTHASELQAVFRAHEASRVALVTKLASEFLAIIANIAAAGHSAVKLPHGADGATHTGQYATCVHADNGPRERLGCSCRG